MPTQLSDLDHPERPSIVSYLDFLGRRTSPTHFAAPHLISLLLTLPFLDFLCLHPHFTSLYGTLFLPYLILDFLSRSHGLVLSHTVACFLCI